MPDRKNELPVIDKPHLSASSLDMFCRCPESWRRRYLDNQRLPPVIPMAKGKAFHAGASLNMEQKIVSRSDLPVADIVAGSVASFEAEIADVENTTDKEVGSAKDSLVSLATAHAYMQALHYQPDKVEEPFRITLDACTHDLLGFIDMIGVVDGETAIVDWKTTGKKPSWDTVHDSVQLTAYAAANMDLATDGELAVRLDVLVDRQKAKGVNRYVFESSRDAGDITALAHRVDMVAKAITAGIFPPAVPGSWWCSPGWCGYWDTCPYVNSERRSKAERLAKVESALKAMEVT